MTSPHAPVGAGRTVADAVAGVVTANGGQVVFGLAGSGNFALTNALIRHGADYRSVNHEAAAVAAADGFGRTSGALGVATVHHGPGLTNAFTALGEAAKSGCPLLLITAEMDADDDLHNQAVEQRALTVALGCAYVRVEHAASATQDTTRAIRRVLVERRPVVLTVPLALLGQTVGDADGLPPVVVPRSPGADPEDAAAIAELLAAAKRPVIVAGRGAWQASAGPALARLAEAGGALLATTAVANGLFTGEAFNLGIAGGFASDVTARLLPQADLILAFGASLNRWTTNFGEQIRAEVDVAQVDAIAAAIGRHRPVRLGLVADAGAGAGAIRAALERREVRSAGWRTPEIRDELAAHHRGSDIEDRTTAGRMDPRLLTIALDQLLPDERTVVLDSGHFMIHPAAYMRVPDPAGFLFTQGFMAVGLGLASAIGAGIARPDRVTVLCIGDGGLKMSLAEIETAARHRVPLLVVVYNDAAYGAEIHDFASSGEPLDIARFVDRDLAAVARSLGADGLTVRSSEDLIGLERWLLERDRPMLVDAKIDPTVVGEWRD